MGYGQTLVAGNRQATGVPRAAGEAPGPHVSAAFKGHGVELRTVAVRAPALTLGL